MWIERIKRLGGVAGLIGLAVLAFVYMKATKPQQPPIEVQEKVWTVDSMVADFTTLSAVQRLYGEVESSALVAAAAPVAAVVEQVRVKEGQSFAAGDRLLSLSADDLDIALRQAQAEVVDVQAQLRLEQLAYEANQQRLVYERKVLAFKQADVVRTQQLVEKDLTSQTALEQVKEALARQEYVVVGAQLAVEEHKLKAEQYQARLAKAQAALAQAKLNAQRGVVVAPYAGRVARVNVSTGDRVSAGSVLLEYYGLESLEVRAKLPITQFQEVSERLQQGQAVQAVYRNAQGEPEHRLQASRLAGVASTSGVDLFFDVPADLRYLRPGELLQVELQGRKYDRALAVPYSALYGNDRLYLIVEGRLQAYPVRLLGDKMVDGALWALVKADFPEGSKISITHLPNAIDGLKVAEAAS